jgi:hypothetical protein
MMLRALLRCRTAAVIIAAAAATLIPASAAFAGGNGSTTQTQHVHGAGAAGIIVIDFLPQDAPALPAGCWANPTLAIVSVDGNAVQHVTVNKAQDFWFTSTFTGDAAVYPVVQPVQFDSDGNVIVDTSGPALYTGHLTTWFGQEDNNQNGVDHATVSFHGADAAGNMVNVNGHVQYATNAAGQPTAQVARVTC